MKDRSANGVMLPAGHTGSSLFHSILTETVTRYSAAFPGVELPTDASAFKRSYGQALARFEACRIASPQRVDIARFIVRRTQEALRFGRGDASVPLGEHLSLTASPPELTRTRFQAEPAPLAEVPLDGRRHRGREIIELADRLLGSYELTQAARDALVWIVERAEADGGRLDLRGQRFVLFGAGAELSPVELLLRAGASVLWVDLTDPARVLSSARSLSGELVHAQGASNLLEQPREIASAIRAFAEDGPVHVGMFAYAPGASKEWRLGAAMNAIVANVDPSLLGSISLLISPTTVSALTPETIAGATERARTAPSWQRALARMGVLSQPSYHGAQGVQVSLATVSLQGLSYQAAQYIAKIAAAETYAVHGTRGQAEGSPPITVSANVAGITRTRSLSHPLFQAAFAGAPKLGVRIFDAASTRALSGLIMLHDLLNPNAPGSASVTAEPREKAARLLSQQVHGGVYSLPYVLEGAIRVAAVVGLAGRPSLLLKKSAPAPVSAAAE